MPVKKESVEIICPDCKIEFRLWVPTTHLTLWEGDDGERVNCIRCTTHFKIRKTIDGVKVFKLQKSIIDSQAVELTDETEPKVSEALQEEEKTTQKPKEKLEETKPKTKEDISKTVNSENKPLIDLDEQQTVSPEPIIQIEEIEEEIIEIEAVELEEASVMGMTQHGETVLFVEDDKLSMAVAENSLIDLNITLLTAIDGEYAIDIINENKIDLIVTDLHLSGDENEHPRVDGEHILQVMADKGLGVPAIVTTGKEMIDDIAMNPKWFPLNVKGFVQKGSPFWSEELKDKIKEIINKEG